MWQDYELPTTAIIDGKELKIRTDYRAILDIIFAMSDVDLSKEQLIEIILKIFYVDYNKITNIEEALKTAMLFIQGNKSDTSNTNNQKLMDWEQDLSLIIPAINKVLGVEIRSLEYLHWWSFLGAYMEIGECTFNTFVGIRYKKLNNIKLDKNEQKIYKNNYDRIHLKERVDKGTQQIMDEIMGRR